jgi:hypothetical protein
LYDAAVAINERDCFTEKTERKPMLLTCQHCRQREEYQITWLRRTKKERLPGGADARDRALFEKLRDHLYRVDDVVTCVKCRRRFEIPSHQSMVFL